MLQPRPLSSALVLVALGLTASCDSPVCVYSNVGCQEGAGGGGAGGLSALGAIFPGDGDFLSSGGPTFLAGAPADILDANVRTPIFLEFSESLNPASLQGAFSILDSSFGLPAIFTPPQLVGNGRVVVMTPIQPLQVGSTYQVFFGEEQMITDINGQGLGSVGTSPLLTFTVGTPTTTPRFLYSYPGDLRIDQGDATEIVIGFDRRMDPASFNNDTFQVTVDGAAPVVNPAPTALQIAGAPAGSGFTQVWLWEPLDGSGRAQSLGADVEVKVLLSQGTGDLLAEGGEVLPSSEMQFQTLRVSMPATVQKNPAAGAPDSFGRADVFGGAPIIDVTLTGAAPAGLTAEIFLFGVSPTNKDLTRSLVRSVAVTQGATSFSLTSTELELFDGAGNVQFADGDFEAAVQFRLNGRSTGVRLFDADPTSPGIDRAIFDTTAPVFLGLGPTGSVTSSFVGNVRDFAAVGRASEPIAFAFVDAGGAGTNGGSLADPPQTAFTAAVPGGSDALFIAAPVPVGAVDPGGAGTTYEITIFDRARNAATLTAVGTYFQRGVVGPGGAPTGAMIDVRVYDERSLRAVPNVAVYSHRESGGGVTFVAQSTTDMNGLAQVLGAASGDTLISVDAPGYDLFTFHGVPRDSLEVLLTVSGIPAASVEGTVTSVFPTGTFTGSVTKVADTRAPRLMRLDDVAVCSPNSEVTRYVCPFGPVSIQGSILGGMTFLATQDSLPQGAFNPVSYLRGFALTVPLGPVAGGNAQLAVELDAGDSFLLGPIADLPIFLTPHVLNGAAASGLGVLDGGPIVTVEAVGAGLASPLIVGRANPYTLGSNTWTVLGAVAGVAGPTGSLAQRSAIDPDLFVRAALRDTAGNEVAARPRLSVSGSVLAPIDVPRILVPAPGSMTGGNAYNIVVLDTLRDSAGGDGFVRVTITGPGGRRWILWGLDTGDAAGDLLLSVPDLAAQGGSALPDGAQSAEVRLWGGNFDRGLFLWSDIEREHELFGRAAPITYTQD